MNSKTNSISAFSAGFRDGIPIGLGYLAVSFSLGIAARNAGFTPLQGFVTSIICLASAGEYAGFTTIAAAAPYLELALITFIANARYLLMSCAMSQKLRSDESIIHRALVGIFMTDEIFAISIARPGSADPVYTYGAGAIAAPLWAVGTALGIIMGNILPARLVSALSVALYGMFLAVIIPPAKKSGIIAGLILMSFAFSFLFSLLPVVSSLTAGTRTIILTVAIAGAAAYFFPVHEDEDSTASGDKASAKEDRS